MVRKASVCLLGVLCVALSWWAASRCFGGDGTDAAMSTLLPQLHDRDASLASVSVVWDRVVTDESPQAAAGAWTHAANGGAAWTARGVERRSRNKFVNSPLGQCYYDDLDSGIPQHCTNGDVVTLVHATGAPDTAYLASCATLKQMAELGEQDWPYAEAVLTLLFSREGPWSSLVEQKRCLGVYTDTLNGEPALRVDLEEVPGTGMCRTWFLPDRGMAAGRSDEVVMLQGTEKQVFTLEAKEWGSVGGFDYPVRLQYVAYGIPPGTDPAVEPWVPYVTQDITVTDLVLDPEVDAGTFAPDLRELLPPGSEVNDFAHGSVYHIAHPAEGEDRMSRLVGAIHQIMESPAGVAPTVDSSLYTFRSGSGAQNRCGLECLDILLRTRNVVVPQDQLAQESGWTSEGGTSFAGLQAAAAQHGLTLTGVELSYEDLCGLGRLAVVPASEGHFVLFVADRGGRALLVQPPDSIVEEPADTFRASWTGQALVPAAALARGSSR
jgi:hypothetical protein